MAKKKATKPKQIQNRRASYDYNLEDELIAGIELKGSEVKNLRMGHGQLRGAYVTIKDDELYLINATISGTNAMPISETDQTRPKKLLVKRKEIDKLLEAKKAGRTIIPLAIMTNGKYIKLKISTAKGKKNYDKRETIKKREALRYSS